MVAFIDAHRETYGVEPICATIAVFHALLPRNGDLTAIA
jgi:hypothetical protein